MNTGKLIKALSKIPIGELRYFDAIGSTNDEALSWAMQDAPDLSLVVANEQTSGRGRMKRMWITLPNSALALSVILRPTAIEEALPSRMSGLMAVSLSESLQKLGLSPRIKWPNDVLLNGCKVAGILVETTWTGDKVDAVVLGLGVNVSSASVPPADQVRFPSTSIEDELKQPVERVPLLADILANLTAWRPTFDADSLLNAWESQLAYRGQQVRVDAAGKQPIIGELQGLDPNGSLRLETSAGKTQTVPMGEVHLHLLA